MNTNKSKNILIITISILIIGNVFFYYKYLVTNKELNQVKVVLQGQKTNEQIVAFNKLFIRDVLKSDTEVSFEKRLELENAVRSLKDNEIITQWQKFTESKTEVQAQIEVKNLLEILANKMKI